MLDETEESRRIVRGTLAFFREFLSPQPADAPTPSLARRALAYWFAHEYAESTAAYGEYVKTHPDDSTAWLRLGVSQAHVQDARAESSLEKAVSLGAYRPVDLYNVACGLALAGRGEKALDFRERAVAAGFRNRQLLSADPDLESVRGSGRFAALMKTLD